MGPKQSAVLVLFAFISLLGCAAQQAPGEPAWVNTLIQKEMSDPVANPPASLTKCTYGGETVYYIPPRCCDIPSTLYDSNGKRICSPDGGFSGGGDGMCPNYSIEKSDCRVVWSDSRTYP